MGPGSETEVGTSRGGVGARDECHGKWEVPTPMFPHLDGERARNMGPGSETEVGTSRGGVGARGECHGKWEDPTPMFPHLDGERPRPYFLELNRVIDCFFCVYF